MEGGQLTAPLPTNLYNPINGISDNFGGVQYYQKKKKEKNFHSQDLTSNSSYCLIYTSSNINYVSLKNLELDQLIMP